MKKVQTAPVASAPPPRSATTSPDRKQAAAPARGRIEKLSTEFAIGWAATCKSGRPAHVYAVVRDEIIGYGVADISRPDLDRARQEGRLDAHAFIIVFDAAVAPAEVPGIQVFIVGQAEALPRPDHVHVDRYPSLRIFLMGSPRSGTSQLGLTLTRVLGLAWLGEGHAAPLFATAANALNGDVNDKNGLSRFMGQQHYGRIAAKAAKSAYFYLHGSASFVDKTPGIRMITAAPFLKECFPDSRFIFQRRNPIGNVLSRMAKFGGNFESHCRDWAGAMNEWLRVRPLLPHYLEIQQEEMLEFPDRVAKSISKYVGVPDSAARISESLRAGSLERTGAGGGKTDYRTLGWTAEQVSAFEKICRPVMKAFGYD